MKTKLIIKSPFWFSKRDGVIEIRECKTGYPYIEDWRKLKIALAGKKLVPVRMEKEEG